MTRTNFVLAEKRRGRQKILRTTSTRYMVKPVRCRDELGERKKCAEKGKELEKGEMIRYR